MASIGISDLRKMDQLRMLCERVGLVPRDSPAQGRGNWDDRIYLVVDGNERTLPVYSRGVYLFSGDLDSCLAFLEGWNRHAEYLSHLQITDSKIRAAEEKHLRQLEHTRTLHALRTGEDPGLERQTVRAAP